MMILIKIQQRDVTRMFIKHVRNIMYSRGTMTGTPRGSPRPSSRHSDSDAAVRAPSFNSRRPAVILDTFEEDSDWTMNYADDLMESIHDQLAELNNLKEAAEHTEAAVSSISIQ